MDKKAVVAMSGGVDSSVAAYTMKERGFDCMGVTMKLFDNEDAGISRERSCCSLSDVEDARDVARKLGIPYYVFNFSDRFREDVMERFVADYERGATPNPCIACNRFLKFDELCRRARELGYDYVATGHYARIERDALSGRYLLKKAAYSQKDQSYVLYAMTQDQLARTVFPLGGMDKSMVREIAARQGFVNARKHDSQDICFVKDGRYADFIEQYRGHDYPPGDFVDMEGNVLGRHKGIIRYTIGQRKGLGVPSPVPLYVARLDVENNTVVLGKSEDLYGRTVTASDINLISMPDIPRPVRLKARIRYRQPEQWATVVQTGEDTIEAQFDEPQRAITRGQAIVFYDGDVVAGGGTIQ